LETKRQIINASVGKSSSELSKQFSLPPTTIRTILGKKDSINNAIGEGKDSKRAHLKPAINANLDNAVLLWMKTVRSQNVPLSGPLLKVKY
jgi:hypothetical protein